MSPSRPHPAPDPDAAPDLTTEERIALGRLIERLRLEHGLVRKSWAAEACNLSDSFWGALERGHKSDGSPATLRDGEAWKIVHGLGLTPAEQAELLEAAKLTHWKPRLLPPLDELLDPRKLKRRLSSFSKEQLAFLEDTVTMRRLELEGRIPAGGGRSEPDPPVTEVLARSGEIDHDGDDDGDDDGDYDGDYEGAQGG
jgi:hypothetical protein